MTRSMRHAPRSRKASCLAAASPWPVRPRFWPSLSPDSADQKFGIEIVRRAVQTPLRQIAENAGEDGAVVSGKVLENDSYDFGFDAQNGDYKGYGRRPASSTRPRSFARLCRMRPQSPRC